MRIVRTLSLLAGAVALTVVACTGGGGGGGGGTGDANKGKDLFAAKACGTCHTITGIPGAVGVIGPTLNGVATAAATRKPGMSAEAYLRESLKDPAAFVVEGFPAPSAGGMVLPIPVTDGEINDLVAYLLTLK